MNYCFALFRPLFDSKSGDNSVQSSPPENRAIPAMPTSQRVHTAVSRTNSHESTASAIGMKTGRLHKVMKLIFFRIVYLNIYLFCFLKGNS